MYNSKKTKIVATLGPSTDSKNTLLEMIKNGVNVFRINFSHAEYSIIEEKIKQIRSINEEYDYSISILGDLQGPKLRIGIVKGGTQVKEGDTIEFITGMPFEGSASQVYMNYKYFPKDVKKGERVVLDDGKLIFEVVSTDEKSKVLAKVIQGGALKSKKGVNLPNTRISLSALTEKDIKDAKFAIQNGVDWLALSFVREKEDLQTLKKLIEKYSPHKIPIIAKIEKPEAIEHINEIVEASDGLMVARGDLGVEVPFEQVPLIQKELVRKAKMAKKPVIIATQMMESMIDSLTPTRAEVNDVANSIMDGADAVMLSGETSVGKYPVEVIKKIHSIIQSVEDSSLISVQSKPPKNWNERFITNAVCYQAAHMTSKIDAKGIVTLTNSGYTAFRISAVRPQAHILVFTSSKHILTQLNLLWGVRAFYYDKMETTDTTIREVNQISKEKGFVEKGDMMINLVAMPIKAKGMVNTLRLTCIE
ncbi:pyruvate kinase [Elysia marginata]|uniref:Pyruvate kinase n=1 Tax=Elysia marginata TaxID=1093978 RepID=A0AAV4JV00_9GAST|nr:pyruvate kinase [Elysia marginata]